LGSEDPSRPASEHESGGGGRRLRTGRDSGSTLLTLTQEPVREARARLVPARAVVVERRVDGLRALLDLRPDVVVNAAGIAAGALVGDTPVGQRLRCRG